jgi:Rrf2 family protein
MLDAFSSAQHLGWTMRFTAQEEYALRGMFDLAYNGPEGCAVQVRVIGERQGIPTRYLEQIFQHLRKAGLVTAKRGPKGGFMLAMSPRRISLGDIFDAVEGLRNGVFARAENDSEEEGRPVTAYQPTFLGPWLTDHFIAMLAGLNLEDLCEQARRAGLPSETSLVEMYHI